MRRNDFRLGEDEMEVGLGLHGEPGAATHQMQRANDIAAQVGQYYHTPARHAIHDGLLTYTQCMAAQLCMQSLSLLLKICE